MKTPKHFNDMSSDEIQEMTDAEFAAVSPFDKKSCHNCSHIQEVLSLWCSNKEAVAFRGTHIPGCIKCPFWAPDWSMIADKYKTAEHGYVGHDAIVQDIDAYSVALRRWHVRLIHHIKSVLSI